MAKLPINNPVNFSITKVVSFLRSDMDPFQCASKLSVLYVQMFGSSHTDRFRNIQISCGAINTILVSSEWHQV